VGIRSPEPRRLGRGEARRGRARANPGLRRTAINISPEHPFPSQHQCGARAAARRTTALTRGVRIYALQLDPEWISRGVIDTIKGESSNGASSRRAATGEPSRRAIRPEWLAGRDRKGVAGPRAERRGDDGAVRRDASGGESRSCARRPMSCAGGSRGDCHVVVNRNINISNVCPVGCAFAASARASDRRCLRTRRKGLRATHPRRCRVRRERAVHPVGIIRTGRSRTTSAAASGQGNRAAADICKTTARWRSRTCVTSPASRPPKVFAPATRRGARLDAGNAAEVLDTTECASASREQAAGRPLGGDHRGSPTRPAALDGARMFGHIEERGSSPSTRVTPRAEGAPVRDQGVRARCRSSVLQRCSAARTESRRDTREENLKQTAVFRLALRRTIESPAGEAGLKMGIEAAASESPALGR